MSCYKKKLSIRNVFWIQMKQYPNEDTKITKVYPYLLSTYKSNKLSDIFF